MTNPRPLHIFLFKILICILPMALPSMELSHTLSDSNGFYLFITFISLGRLKCLTSAHCLCLSVVLSFCLHYVFLSVLSASLSICPSFLLLSVSRPFIFSIISPPGFLSLPSFGRAGGDAALQFDKCMFSKHSNYLNPS